MRTFFFSQSLRNIGISPYVNAYVGKIIVSWEIRVSGSSLFLGVVDTIMQGRLCLLYTSWRNSGCQTDRYQLRRLNRRTALKNKAERLKHMKYSVSLYSFYNALKRNLITPFACIEQAKDLGFDAVEAVDFVNFDCVPCLLYTSRCV